MKVLNVCEVLFPQTVGGAGRAARSLAVALARQGVQIAFFTRDTSSRPVDDAFPITYYPPPGRSLPSDLRRRLSRQIREFQPDLIHVHQAFPAYFGLQTPPDLPYVYTFYSPWAAELIAKASPWPVVLRRLVRPLYAHIERSVLESASTIAVLSRFSAHQLEEAYGLKSRVIPGGVDIDHFAPPPAPVNAPGTRLITVRNLVPRMGLESLIDAMGLLPPNFELEIAGAGPLKNALVSRIRESGLHDRVRLRGRVPDEELPRFYGEADWFVLPTRELEGFGLVILESLACGTPVLGTRIGAIPELLERLDPEWVISDPSPGAIARTIRHVAGKGRVDRDHLRNFALQYSWDTIADQYLRLYKNVIAGA
jgi:glycosyltransferase involved in cell wall biosynthesis